jgi:hypothetical protein
MADAFGRRRAGMGFSDGMSDDDFAAAAEADRLKGERERLEAEAKAMDAPLMARLEAWDPRAPEKRRGIMSDPGAATWEPVAPFGEPRAYAVASAPYHNPQVDADLASPRGAMGAAQRLRASLGIGAVGVNRRILMRDDAAAERTESARRFNVQADLTGGQIVSGPTGFARRRASGEVQTFFPPPEPPKPVDPFKVAGNRLIDTRTGQEIAPEAKPAEQGMKPGQTFKLRDGREAIWSDKGPLDAATGTFLNVRPDDLPDSVVMAMILSDDQLRESVRNSIQQRLATAKPAAGTPAPAAPAAPSPATGTPAPGTPAPSAWEKEEAAWEKEEAAAKKAGKTTFAFGGNIYRVR